MMSTVQIMHQLTQGVIKHTKCLKTIRATRAIKAMVNMKATAARIIPVTKRYSAGSFGFR